MNVFCVLKSGHFVVVGRYDQRQDRFQFGNEHSPCLTACSHYIKTVVIFIRHQCLVFCCGQLEWNKELYVCDTCMWSSLIKKVNGMKKTPFTFSAILNSSRSPFHEYTHLRPHLSTVLNDTISFIMFRRILLMIWGLKTELYFNWFLWSCQLILVRHVNK